MSRNECFLFCSLNWEKRKQELHRVQKENKIILERITNAEPWYRAQRWWEDWARGERLQAAMAKHPQTWLAHLMKRYLWFLLCLNSIVI
jgi:hypothetical protein